MYRSLCAISLVALVGLGFATPVHADVTHETFEGQVGCSVRIAALAFAPNDVCSDSESFAVQFPANTTTIGYHLEWDQVAAGVDDLQLRFIGYPNTAVEGASPLVGTFDGPFLPEEGWETFVSVRAANGAVVQTPFVLTLTTVTA